MVRSVIVLFFLCLTANIISGQRSLIQQANTYLDNEKYVSALDIYNQLEDIHEKKNLLYNRGRAYYALGFYRQAIEDFTAAFNKGLRDRELYLYAGKALHRMGRYDEAAIFYKDYLNGEKDEQNIGKVIEYIKQTGYGFNMQYADQNAYVENIGPSVNTSADEISPIVSPSASSKYYFSSNRDGSTGGLRDREGYVDEVLGNYAHDLYAVELKNGNWSSIIAFDPILNGPKNDIIQGFSQYGEVLFYITTLDMKRGQLYVDTFQMDRPSDKLPQKFISPIKTELGDKCLSVFDNETIFFSSNRLGGYGGYDIYAIKYLDSFWSEPINLGASINTAFNELDPYLVHNGTKLYFSSDRTDGYGGYDIFMNNYGLETQMWGETENVGLPINSPADDRYFNLSKDGQTGILASNREGTLGGYDLLLAYLKDAVVEQDVKIAQVPFLMAKEEMPKEDYLSEIDTLNRENNIAEEDVAEAKEIYIKNLFYGDDENVLNPKNLVTLKTVVDLLKVYPHTEIILTGNSIIEGLLAFDLYFSIKRAEKIAQYLNQQGIALERIHVKGLGPNFPLVQMNAFNISRSAKLSNRRIDISIVTNGENVEVIKEKNNILDNVRDPREELYRTTVKGLSYKINFNQVKQMYKGDELDQYPEATIEKRADEDYYTYSFGIYEKYREARGLRNKLIQNGLLNATITPYMDGIEIPSYKINELSQDYPDLQDYLSFER